jgi:hypothetical protein
MHYFRVPRPPGISARISFQATYPYLYCKDIILNSLANATSDRPSPLALETDMDATAFEIRLSAESVGGGGVIFSREILRSLCSLRTMILVGSSFFGENRQGRDAACSFVQARDLPETGQFHPGQFRKFIRSRRISIIACE